MAKPAKKRSPYVTQKGKDGTRYLYEVDYQSDASTYPVFKIWMWAYDMENLQDRFYGGADSDEGWVFVSAKRLTERDLETRGVKRNPFTWRSSEDPVLSTAVGAGVGSLAGMILGGPLGAKGLGSVVGGALGGYAGAPRDRKRRGAWGGGIGGLFTPLGAAGGGAIGGRKPSAKTKGNPWAYAGVKFSPARERLQELTEEIQRAHVRAEMAESRREFKEAQKWRKIEHEAELLLEQLEDRLQLLRSERGPAIPNPMATGKALRNAGPCPGLARNPGTMSCADLTALAGNCYCAKKNPTNLPPKALRQWEAIYKSAQNRGSQASSAAAQAWSVVKRTYKKTGKRWVLRKVKLKPPKKNPAARTEVVDDLTGHRIGGLTYGGTRTPQKVVRTRPAKGKPFQTVLAEGYTLDSRRDTFGIDPQFDDSYKERAAKQEKTEAKARKKPPMPRNADVELSRLGIATTFKTVDDALRQIEGLNPSYFENRLLDDLDASDVTRDFMDRIEVAQGGRGKRRYAKLSTLPRGQEILAAKGVEQIRAMLLYFLGTAKGKRWRNVPWNTVDGYIETISRALDDESRRQRVHGGVTALENYPLGSSRESSNEFLARVAQEVGPAAAQKLADIRNSQELWGAVGRLEAILAPAKGDRLARSMLKCIPKDARKLLRSRIRTLTDWAKWPNLVPTWACVPDQRFESAMLCTHSAILEDVRKIENACAIPYDVTWPAQLRKDLWDENGEVAVGVYPMGPESSKSESQYQQEERLSVPWEAAANPRSQSLKRRLMR